LTANPAAFGGAASSCSASARGSGVGVRKAPDASISQSVASWSGSGKPDIGVSPPPLFRGPRFLPCNRTNRHFLDLCGPTMSEADTLADRCPNKDPRKPRYPTPSARSACSSHPPRTSTLPMSPRTAPIKHRRCLALRGWRQWSKDLVSASWIATWGILLGW